MVKLFAARAGLLFHRRQTSILSAAVVIMITVAASRILGLVRDRILASNFTTEELGIYFAAFRIPNLLFELLVMGALSTAFIPVIAELVAKNKKEEVFHVTSSVITIGLVFILIASTLLTIFARPVAGLIAPGFNEEQLDKLVIFTRIMLLGQVIPLVIGNFLTGMLQSMKLFIIPALAPVFYNVGIIISIIFLTPMMGLYAPVWGVVLGAFLFLFIQIPLVYSNGYRFSLSFDYQNLKVRTIGKLMLPRTFGLAVSQIDTTVDLILASLLGASSVTIFNFAQHLQLVPIGLFGIPIATAALPSLSQNGMSGNKQEYKDLIIKALHQILFLVLPASIILVVLRIPVVRLVFGADRFNWSDTVLTGKTLAAFSISLFAQSTIHLITRAFFALQDSKTPVIVGIGAIIINTLLSAYFIMTLKLPVWGLGLSASIASIFNAFLLLIILYKKIGGLNLPRLIIPTIKMCFSTLITGISLYIPMKLLDQFVFDTTRTVDLIMLTAVATFIGLGVYIFCSWMLALEEVALFIILTKKVIKVKELFIETSREVVEEGNIQHTQ